MGGLVQVHTYYYSICNQHFPRLVLAGHQQKQIFNIMVSNQSIVEIVLTQGEVHSMYVC